MPQGRDAEAAGFLESLSARYRLAPGVLHYPLPPLPTRQQQAIYSATNGSGVGVLTLSSKSLLKGSAQYLEAKGVGGSADEDMAGATGKRKRGRADVSRLASIVEKFLS